MNSKKWNMAWNYKFDSKTTTPSCNPYKIQIRIYRCILMNIEYVEVEYLKQ